MLSTGSWCHTIVKLVFLLTCCSNEHRHCRTLNGHSRNVGTKPNFPNVTPDYTLLVVLKKPCDTEFAWKTLLWRRPLLAEMTVGQYCVYARRAKTAWVCKTVCLVVLKQHLANCTLHPRTHPSSATLSKSSRPTVPWTCYYTVCSLAGHTIDTWVGGYRLLLVARLSQRYRTVCYE